MSANPSEPIYFHVSDAERNIFGYTWRAWAGGTSFYLLARQAGLLPVKISLHGPDQRESVGPPGFKLEVFPGRGQGAEQEALTVNSLPNNKLWFPGHEVSPGARLVVRFRTTWDMFDPRLPSAPAPKGVPPGTGRRLPAPREYLVCADVDFFVSDGRPYWPDEKQARTDNSAIGPLRNAADQYLTAVSYRRSTLSLPTPANAQGPPPRTREDSLRALGTAKDERGTLWFVEQWMSRKGLTEIHRKT